MTMGRCCEDFSEAASMAFWCVRRGRIPTAIAAPTTQASAKKKTSNGRTPGLPGCLVGWGWGLAIRAHAQARRPKTLLPPLLRDANDCQSAEECVGARC